MNSFSIKGPPWVLRCVASSSKPPARTPKISVRPYTLAALSPSRSQKGYQSLCDVEHDASRQRHVLVHHRRRRLATSATRSQLLAQDHSKPSVSPAQETPYARLSPVLQALPGPIDWGVAYGSGVIAQANTSSLSSPPLTDFLISTPDPTAFHTENIRRHPSHYPFYARWMGGAGVARMQERWGAGVWYITNVHLCGLEIKYGIISTPRLKVDLEQWDTLYVAGRLQKPVLPLRIPRSLESSLTQNLNAALSLALLYLPETFSEMALWEEIAGISYSGDPRMSVPGAENPQKVKNIVRGPGVREGFREMYGGLISNLGPALAWEEDPSAEKKPGTWAWRGEGEDILHQSSSSGHRMRLFNALPKSLQTSVTQRLGGAATGLADVIEDSRFREVLQAEVGKIIRQPALSQSFKGLITAGPVKSFWYGLAKIRKWWAGRAKTS